jgi:1,4-alpha-glucan branching enzyme
VQSLVRDLNHIDLEEPALWERDSDHEGFWWIEPNDADANIVAFARADRAGGALICVCNLSPVVRENYRLGLPCGGTWRERLNTDSTFYGGSDVGNSGSVEAEATPWHGQPHSAQLTLPPLAVLWLVPEREHAPQTSARRHEGTEASPSATASRTSPRGDRRP